MALRGGSPGVGGAGVLATEGPSRTRPCTRLGHVVSAVSMVRVPQHFLTVRYDGARFPGTPGVAGIAQGANCQQFAYELLRHFGYAVPDLRSSELWADTEHTSRADTLEPFDL